MATTAKRPNVVFILVDDMGYGDFSRFNNGLSSTPTLDSLMDEGICLTQHYTASPVCNPSRAALLTGRYPHRTGSVDTLEWRGLERLALRERTMADMLGNAGYATGLTGKWHLGAFDLRYHPTRRGFDETVCFRGGTHDYYDWRVEYGSSSVKRADGRYMTDLWTEEAVQFIHRHKKDPFFLHVTYNAPHTPLQAPEGYIRQFEDREKLNWGVRCIYAMIKAMDEGVARILDTLKRLELEENTIVVFSSDNGPQLNGTGDKCIDRFNCNLHGSKGSVYEGGIRVPGIVRWPASGLTGGREINEMTHFTDWLPTILAMTDVKPPPGNLPLDGINMLPALKGEKGKVCTKRCWQWNRYSPVPECNAAIRDGDWKLVRPVIAEAMTIPDIAHIETSMYRPEYFIENGIFKGDPDRVIPKPPPVELYNIAEDPKEKNNLAETHPDRAAKLLTELQTWFESVEADRLSIDDEWLLNAESGWADNTTAPTAT